MPGLIRGVARTAAVVGTATAVSNRVSRRQANRWEQQEEAKAYEAQQAAGYPPPPPPPAQYQQAPPTYQEAPPQYQQAPPPPAAPPPAAAPDTNEKLAQLQQLGELKAQGILTDVEFEIQKQKILNS
jgi:hypothetical protein